MPVFMVCELLVLFQSFWSVVVYGSNVAVLLVVVFCTVPVMVSVTVVPLVSVGMVHVPLL